MQQIKQALQISLSLIDVDIMSVVRWRYKMGGDNQLKARKKAVHYLSGLYKRNSHINEKKRETCKWGD